MRVICACCALLLAAGTLAAPLNTVVVGDLPGSGGNWQFGEVTVAAPVGEVQRWFADAAYWPARFPDDKWARDLGRTPDGRRVAQFYSRTIGRPLTVRLRERPGLIVYDGSGKGITTQGKIILQSAGPRQTRVIMQSTGEVHGLAGAFATTGVKRKRTLKKMRSDLEAVIRLSRQYAAARGHAG
jgi:hypothetical protein